MHSHRKIYIFQTFLLVLAILLLALHRYCLKNGIALTQQFSIMSGSSHGSSKVFVTLEKNKEKHWPEADGMEMFQLDCLLHNEEKYVDITDWKIKIEVPEEFRFENPAWSCVLSQEDNTLTARQLLEDEVPDPAIKEAYCTVHAGAVFSFGAIVHAKAGWAPEKVNFSLTYTPIFAYSMSRASKIIEIVLIAIIVFSLAYNSINGIRDLEDKHRAEQTKKFITNILTLFTNLIEAKDPYTKGHSERVAIYSREIAKRLKLSQENQSLAYYCALLHDTGKLVIDNSILNKTDKFTHGERWCMESHAEIGSEIFRNFEYLPGMADIIRHHHERYNGTGYPDGLKGNEIPLLSRIIFAADCFDAMTTDRIYRKHISTNEVKKELLTGSGVAFDPAIAAIMLSMLNDGVIPIQNSGSYNL